VFQERGAVAARAGEAQDGNRFASATGYTGDNVDRRFILLAMDAVRASQRLTSPPTRYRLQFTAIVAMVAAVTLGVPPEPTRFWNALFDVGHVLVFAAITIILLDLVGSRQTRPGPRSAMGWTVAATLALAAGTELLQAVQPNHDAAFGDFVRDMAGMSLVLLLRRAGPSAHINMARRLTFGLIAVAVLGPFFAVVGIYGQRNRAFPIVMPLNGSSWERRLLSFHGSELVPGKCEIPGSPAGDALARLSLRPGRYPGLFLDEPYPDWRAFDRLVFRAAMDADQSITLTLRINDARHNGRYADRFNIRLDITPGDHRIEIPLETIRSAPEGRKMDLGHIRGIGVFAFQLNRPTHVCLSAFRLE
jgi:VanZ family protein